ncbi:hypothetical protein EJB05_21676 [Eragrostis curvula]|uniref:DUF6598 domain-containing protein n=1 Tax=Eragrostis curvula TaxID=38414 RepID=A0A5J9V401_9POAL|nr:hypothetical protein EJB05_21676 [Eragrostis curvula]
MMADLGGGVSMSTCGVYEGLGLDEFIPGTTYKVRDFSFDPGMDEAERAARAERLKKEALEEASHMEDVTRAKRYRAQARILDFDPKQNGIYYNRLSFVDLASFDLDEESPRGPMRFTNAVYKNKGDYELCEAINIFSINIASSDVGFPIHVYGTVIARDSLDKKCVYLFRCDRYNSQLINSEEDSLIMTGPKRGLVLIGDVYVETDLKIKDDGEQEDKQLSKGMLTIRGIARRTLKKCELEIGSLATRLSTVNVAYGVVKDAVEGTLAIEVRQGDFDGKISACATSIKKSLMLYDSKVTGTVTADVNGVIQLLQSVISVYLKEMLEVTIVAGDGETKVVDFAPKVSGGEKLEITVGDTLMLVQVTWSIMDW